MKKLESVVKEYVHRLPDDDLEDIGMRFSQKLCGDYCEIAQKVQRDKEVDQWLKSAISSDEFFAMMDQLADAISREQNKREKEKA